MQNAFLKLAAERYISKHEMSWFQFAIIRLQHIVFQYHRLLIAYRAVTQVSWVHQEVGRGLEARKKEEEEENKDILEESNKETVSDGDDQR